MFNDISPEGYQSPLIPFVSDYQQKTDTKDREETLAQLPLLKTVLNRLDSKIAATDSIEKAIEVATKYQISRDNALVALNIVNQQLKAERGYIQNRIDRLK